MDDTYYNLVGALHDMAIDRIQGYVEDEVNRLLPSVLDYYDIINESAREKAIPELLFELKDFIKYAASQIAYDWATDVYWDTYDAHKNPHDTTKDDSAKIEDFWTERKLKNELACYVRLDEPGFSSAIEKWLRANNHGGRVSVLA